MKSLAFTGHRPKDLGGYSENNPTALQVKAKLRELIIQSYESGYRVFITGMAMGVDQWAGEIVAELKNNYDDIKLIAAIPFVNQSSVWVSSSQQSWQKLLAQCDEIYVVDRNPDIIFSLESLLSESRTPSTDPKYLISKKLNDRNKFMVDKADCLLAIWRHTPGGTGNCVQYAQSKGKKIITYNPDDDTMTKL